MKKIIKRDGRVVTYNSSKINNAKTKAAVEEIDISKIISNIEQTFADTDRVRVEQIQDEVEKELMAAGAYETAKKYILYRSERSKARDAASRLMKTYKDITFQSAAENNIKRENANIDCDTAMGTMLKYGSEGAKHFNELYLLKPEYTQAHRDGNIHIHDLDFLALTTTCCQIDLTKLFEKGFSTGHGFIRKPNSIQSYASLAAIVIQANQNDQHGGQSIPCFDYDLAEGVRKTYASIFRRRLTEFYIDCEETTEDFARKAIDAIENITEKDNYCLSQRLFMSDKYVTKIAKQRARALADTDRATHQAMEAFVHNLNTMHSRAGAQVPFSSVNFGTDTSEAGRMVTKNLLLAINEGLGNGETAIFPVSIFKVKEGVNYNEGDPNYDLFKLACKVSAKRLFPNFAFLDAPFNAQYYRKGRPETECAYMGCRTRVIANNYDSKREIVTGRGNLSFTSINLPRLAIEANHDINKFYEGLTEMLNLVAEQLYERYLIIAKKTAKNFPFLMGQGVWLDSEKLKPNKEIADILKHGTLTIGFIGLAECLKALIGQHHGESEEAQKLGLEIIGFMRNATDNFAREKKMNYSLIATPAEGLSGRFVGIDKKRYGIIEGVTDREYYTNSFHVPVYYQTSIYEKIKKEAPYHALTNGGHITYVELDGDPLKNVDAFEKIVRCMKEEGIGYGSINHPVDRDPVCGYTGIINDKCPHCQRKETTDKPKFERIRRITGYLVGTLDRFNDAKLAEVRDRVSHSKI